MASDRPPRVWSEPDTTYRVFCEVHGLVAGSLNYWEVPDAMESHKREHADGV